MRGTRSAGRAIFAILLAAAVSAAASAGCGGADEGAILIGGERVDSATIDRDPLALLPSGIVMLSYLDAGTLFSSSSDRGSAARHGLLPLWAESTSSRRRCRPRLRGCMQCRGRLLPVLRELRTGPSGGATQGMTPPAPS